MTQRPPATLLTIGQVAVRTGLSVHALRFYEREGLFATPVHRRGGRRVYSEGDIDWLAVCTILRGAGMPLSDVRRYIELVRIGAGTEAERLGLLREHERRVLARRKDLDRCLDLIHHKIGVYEDILDRGASDHGCVAPPSELPSGWSPRAGGAHRCGSAADRPALRPGQGIPEPPGRPPGGCHDLASTAHDQSTIPTPTATHP